MYRPAQESPLATPWDREHRPHGGLAAMRVNGGEPRGSSSAEAVGSSILPTRPGINGPVANPMTAAQIWRRLGRIQRGAWSLPVPLLPGSCVDPRRWLNRWRGPAESISREELV